MRTYFGRYENHAIASATSTTYFKGIDTQNQAVRVKIAASVQLSRVIQILSINKYKRLPLKQYGAEPKQSKYNVRETEPSRRHYNIKNNM